MGLVAAYEALSTETLGARLSDVVTLAEKVGPDASAWTVREVGDGNLNLVFIVKGPKGSAIVKQALPYVRIVGDSWPLPLYRAFYEFHALRRQAERDPGSVPDIYHFDGNQALIVMEFLSPHVILRRKLINGERVDGLADRIGTFCARTAFRGSELCMKSADKKADVAMFAGNVEIPAITEGLVFTDPYFNAARNHYTKALHPAVIALRANTDIKIRVQRMKMKFASNTETMIHGDLHSGSIMATDHEAKVIDPEFAQYGPLGFDIGMLTANYLMAYFSQPAHRGDDLNVYQDWLLSVIVDTFAAFRAEFNRLWHTERTGILYPHSLFEDQGQPSDAACESVLREIWTDAVSICGIEMHRRVLSLAHNADFEDIKDEAVRALLEARNLMMGQVLILNAESITDVEALCALAREYNTKDML